MTENRPQISIAEQKEAIAQEKFGEHYHHLSAWGKRTVDEELGKAESPPIQGSLPRESGSATLERENERLSRALENAQQENLDLWDEVTELKTELAQLRADLNLPSSS